eukprot:GHVT01064208.1.p1 GENE.GHVT01064208.1~~GHVT01064208.1.p1  ORF type:complete len:329 (+),score=53.08 GHVT01064208.1:216-1202(+)
MAVDEEGRRSAADGGAQALRKRRERVCGVCHFLRGSVAGTVAKSLVYPFDRLKMIHQVKGSVVGQFRFQRLFSLMRQITRSEGLGSLWKGNLTSFARTFPHSGIVFWSFEKYFNLLRQTQLADYPAACRLLAGGLAGVTSTVLTYPLDVWNTRFAVSSVASSYHQVTLVSYEGWGSLYRGLGPTLLGIFPYAGISFLTFETLKARVKRSRGEEAFGAAHSLVCGGLAGVVSQTATYPIDTVRKFMQANSFLYKVEEAGHHGNREVTIANAVRHIVRTTGVRGLYNGVSLNWGKGFAAAGLSFTLNDALRKLLANAHCPPALGLRRPGL